MNEVFFNIKLTIAFMFILSFVGYWNIKLKQHDNFHGIDFEGLNINFSISGSTNTEEEDNIIYIKDTICSSGIPEQCIGQYNKKSIKCLSAIKETYNGYYNGYYFSSTDPSCKTNL